MRTRSFACAALLALVTCGDPVAPPAATPQPGVLAVRLTTPNAGDAALLLRVTGPGAMTNVVAGSAALEVESRIESAATAFNAAVFGDLATGTVVLRFSVPDVGQSASYAATLVEVADASSGLRTTSGYLLTVEAP